MKNKRAKEPSVETIGRIIARRTSAYNGWWFDEDGVRELCERAARDVLAYVLRVRPSRAARKEKP